MYLEEIQSEDLNWIHLAQDRAQWHALVNMKMNIQVPYKTSFLHSEE
jgi:hypothetical protein